MRRGRFFRSTDGIRTNEVRDKIRETIFTRAKGDDDDGQLFLKRSLFVLFSLARAHACSALYIYLSMNKRLHFELD